MARRVTKIATVAIAVGLFLGLSARLGLGHSGAVGTTVTPSTSAAGALPSDFYLAVGASTSLGYQPMGIKGGREHATTTGYANDLVSIEAKRAIALDLYQIGCPGETFTSMLSAIDHCYPSSDGQLAHATQFLRSHRNATGLVTIDLGFNDVRACLTRPAINQACANEGLSAVRASIPRVLSALQASSGPHVHFVGLLVDDPFLGHYLKGANGRLDAAQTLQTMNTLNEILRANYAAAKIPVADVAAVFKSDNQTLVPLTGFGSVPTNVATVCELTWICNAAPWGPDDHPNNAGHLAIAKAIVAALGTSW
jgi:lysophospholipase L1-like esterase